MRLPFFEFLLPPSFQMSFYIMCHYRYHNFLSCFFDLVMSRWGGSIQFSFSPSPTPISTRLCLVITEYSKCYILIIPVLPPLHWDAVCGSELLLLLLLCFVVNSPFLLPHHQLFETMEIYIQINKIHYYLRLNKGNVSVYCEAEARLVITSVFRSLTRSAL